MTISSDSANAQFDSTSINVVITDNDIEPVDESKGDFTYTIADASVTEGVMVSITITRSADGVGEAKLHLYTSNGSGVAGTDYDNIDRTILFTDGSFTQTVGINTYKTDLASGSSVDFTVTLEGIGTKVSTGATTVSINGEAVVVTPPSTTPEKSSGGGSFGFGLGLIALLAFRRKTQG